MRPLSPHASQCPSRPLKYQKLDGFDDIVGFGSAGTYVALATGGGGYALSGAPAERPLPTVGHFR
jgi:hypothetical protein